MGRRIYLQGNRDDDGRVRSVRFSSRSGGSFTLPVCVAGESPVRIERDTLKRMSFREWAEKDDARSEPWSHAPDKPLKNPPTRSVSWTQTRSPVSSDGWSEFSLSSLS